MAKEPSQLDKFKAAARELETNNDPDAFDRRMRRMKLATKKPPSSGKKKPPEKR